MVACVKEDLWTDTMIVDWHYNHENLTPCWWMWQLNRKFWNPDFVALVVLFWDFALQKDQFFHSTEVVFYIERATKMWFCGLFNFFFWKRLKIWVSKRGMRLLKCKTKFMNLVWWWNETLKLWLRPYKTYKWLKPYLMPWLKNKYELTEFRGF